MTLTFDLLTLNGNVGCVPLRPIGQVLIADSSHCVRSIRDTACVALPEDSSDDDADDLPLTVDRFPLHARPRRLGLVWQNSIIPAGSRSGRPS